MKKFLIAMLMFAGIFTLAGCDPYIDPVDYNDQIVDYHDNTIDVYNDFYDLAIATDLDEDLSLVQAKLTRTVTTIKEYKTELEAIQGYQGDTSLRDVVIAYLTVTISVLDNERTELNDLWMQRSTLEGDIPQDEIDREGELTEAIDTQTDAAFDNIVSVQAAFSQKHGYDLIEEEVEVDVDAVE